MAGVGGECLRLEGERRIELLPFRGRAVETHERCRDAGKLRIEASRLGAEGGIGRSGTGCCGRAVASRCGAKRDQQRREKGNGAVSVHWRLWW